MFEKELKAFEKVMDNPCQEETFEFAEEVLKIAKYKNLELPAIHFLAGFRAGEKAEREKSKVLMSPELEHEFLIAIERIIECRYEDDKIHLIIMNLKSSIIRYLAKTKDKENG
jgi:hypothetical protein